MNLDLLLFRFIVLKYVTFDIRFVFPWREEVLLIAVATGVWWKQRVWPVCVCEREREGAAWRAGGNGERKGKVEGRWRWSGPVT